MAGSKVPPTQNPSMPTPTATLGVFWPVDLTRVRIGPKFMGHAAYGNYRSGYGYHTGTDFLGPLRLEVFAIADGVIESSTPTASARGYGENIVIHHEGLGGWGRYSHLNQRVVVTGEKVKAGQLIGYMGMSGTDNIHLHFDWIVRQLPNPRFNPHNPATGGVALPKTGLDPVEAELVKKYFADGLVKLNKAQALNPVTRKVAVA